MILYAKIISAHEWKIQPGKEGQDGWYKIDRRPDFENREYLEYDAVKDIIEIKQMEKPPGEIEREIKRGKRDAIRELYSPTDEYNLLRRTLKKVLHQLGISDDEFDKYYQDVEDILQS